MTIVRTDYRPKRARKRKRSPAIPHADCRREEQPGPAAPAIAEAVTERKQPAQPATITGPRIVTAKKPTAEGAASVPSRSRRPARDRRSSRSTAGRAEVGDRHGTKPKGRPVWAGAGDGRGGAPHLKTPYVYQYNLSIQREVAHNTTASVSYLGSDSHELTGLADANPFILGTNTRVLNSTPAATALSAWARVLRARSAIWMSSTTWAGRITTLLRPDSHGEPARCGTSASLEYQVSYTYSKSLDNESGFRSAQGQVPACQLGPVLGSLELQRAQRCSRSAASGRLPFDQAWSSGPKRLTQGWELDPVFNYRSGLPLNVKDGISDQSRPSRDRRATATRASSRPNLVGSSVQMFTARRTSRLWSPAARRAITSSTRPTFSNASLKLINTVGNPGASSYGTLGKNAFKGPDLVNLNLTIRKTIEIHERYRVGHRCRFL